MRKIAAEKLGDVLHKELQETCVPSKSNSIFCEKTTSSLLSFKWTSLCNDLRRTAPTLSLILEKCVNKQHNQSLDIKQSIVIAMVSGILLRNCSQRANYIQRLISILLYASHAPKKVI
jgi:hypothetical protein